MMSKITPSSQDSSQEPSTSSKYDFKDGGFLTNFLSWLMAEIWQTSKESHIMTIHNIKDVVNWEKAYSGGPKADQTLPDSGRARMDGT